MFFVEKMREAFALQKLLTFFKKKYWHISVLTFEILRKRLLTTSLVLNNQALLFMWDSIYFRYETRSEQC